MAIDINKLEKKAKSITGEKSNIKESNGTIHNEDESLSPVSTKIGKLNSVVDTFSNSAEKLSTSFERVIGALNKKTEIENKFVLDIKKLEEDRRKNEIELVKYLDDNHRLEKEASEKHEERMAEISKKHEERMAEIENQKIIELKRMDTIKEICFKYFDIIEACKRDGILDNNLVLSTSKDVKDYLSDLNKVQLLMVEDTSKKTSKDE